MKKRVLAYEGTKPKGGLLDVVSLLPGELESARSTEEFLNKLERFRPHVVLVDLDFQEVSQALKKSSVARLLRGEGRSLIFLSARKNPEFVIRAKKEGATDYILKPYNARELLAHVNAALQGKKRVTCLGGGTGLFTLLLGLKKLPNVLLTSIVSMSDDGGSSGKLRATFGILPPGDIRRSLVGLSNAPELMNRVIQYRFEKGPGLRNHSFGNLFLTVLSEIKGSMPQAVEALGDILNIQGIVLPVTPTLTELVARFEDKTVIRGESKIDLAENRKPNLRITDLWLEPEAECNPPAYASILFSDLVIIGPGDLFTSLGANLSVKGIREALSRTEAKKVYICNVMTKPGETFGYTASDHVRQIVKFLGKDLLDYVLLSNTSFSKKALAKYARKGQTPVLGERLEEIQKVTRAEILVSDLAHEEILVRHDSEKIKGEIKKLVENLPHFRQATPLRPAR